jgi:hypothetical protein
MEYTSAGGNSFTLAFAGRPILPFKVGDKVKCVDNNSLEGAFSLDRVYHVRDVNANYVYFHDVSGGYYLSRFVLVNTELTPSARANDPATSKGKRKVNKYERAVLDMLRGGTNGYPIAPIKSWALTGKEIAAQSGHPLNCITPRFAPLRRKGLIKDSGTKRDKQIVWVLA